VAGTDVSARLRAIVGMYWLEQLAGLVLEKLLSNLAATAGGRCDDLHDPLGSGPVC